MTPASVQLSQMSGTGERAHPERDAWRAWVSEGFQAMYGADARPSGGVVHVRAYVRNGHAVAAHTRGAPAGSGAGAIEDRSPATSTGVQFEGPSSVHVGFRGLPLHRRNLLDGGAVVPAMARRPEDGVVGGRRGVIPEGGGGGGGGYRPPSAGRPTQAPTVPPVSSRSQEIVDMVAPGGRPLGNQYRGAAPDVRTLGGGQRGAEAMLNRLIEGRSPVDITPRGYQGRLYRLDDGSIVGYRPTSNSGVPGIDINIPGFRGVTKLHFVD